MCLFLKRRKSTPKSAKYGITLLNDPQYDESEREAQSREQ